MNDTPPRERGRGKREKRGKKGKRGERGKRERDEMEILSPTNEQYEGRGSGDLLYWGWIEKEERRRRR